MTSTSNKHSNEKSGQLGASDTVHQSDSLSNPDVSVGLKTTSNVEATPHNNELSTKTHDNIQIDTDGASVSASDKQLKLQIADLEHQLSAKQKMIDQLNADHLRARADMENYKKRLLKERADAIDFANQSLISGILDVLDNFDRAINANAAPQNHSNFQNGINLIYQQLQQILYKDWHVAEIDALHKEFDPVFHEAVVFEEDKNCKVMKVADVLQKGYSLRGRVIRPARVKIKKPVE